MKKQKSFFLFTLLLSLFSLELFSSTEKKLTYDDFFDEACLRIDYYQAFGEGKEMIFFKELKKEPRWAGRKHKLIDSFDYGSTRVQVFDLLSKDLLFSYHFSSLFDEWLHTEDAMHTARAFPGSILLPFPKNKIIVELQKRAADNKSFSTIWEQTIDPNDIFINAEKAVQAQVKQIKFAADPADALDLSFISEGYTQDELPEFYQELENLVAYLFSVSPFDKLKDKINVWAIEAISQESGTDLPHQGVWKSTVLNTTYSTFGSERYLTSLDFHTIRNYAALAPSDQVCVLVNTEKYGGGGIYNFWNITSSKNEHRNEVFVHELGHALAALADEYDSEDEMTENFYALSVEPYESNITNLVNFESKWKSLLSPKTKIPTEIKSENKNKLGVYEGAGYKKKGIYRPYIDCKMRSLNQEFCPVCEKTIIELTNSYCR